MTVHYKFTLFLIKNKDYIIGLLILLFIIGIGIAIYIYLNDDDDDDDDDHKYCDLNNKEEANGKAKGKSNECDTLPDTTMYDNMGTLIDNQDESTVQIYNNTTEDFLHVFITSRTNTQQWEKIDGSGTISDLIDWSFTDYSINPNGVGIAWDPLGAKIASEIIIPKNEYIILQNPIPITHGVKGNVTDQFQMIPIKMKTENVPLKKTDPVNASRTSLMYDQQAIILEAGQKAVSDISAVVGINYKVHYELTSSDKKGNPIVKKMTINKNPCERLSSLYQLEVGCINPVEKDCINFESKSTATCNIGSQNCKFNKCSDKLFNIPCQLDKYRTKLDGGKLPGHTSDGGPLGEPVKLFINNSNNLKPGSDLKKYCEDIQCNTGDFEPYCYDYNDTGASPTLTDPYKIKIIISDL